MEAIFPFLLDVSTKSAAIVAAALLFCMAARRGSAALRHLVGALAMTGVVAMPLLSVALPAWHIGWLDRAVQPPQTELHGSVAAPHAQPIAPSIAAVPPHEHPSSHRENRLLPVGGVDAAPAPSIAPAPATTALKWPLWAVTSYLLGLGFLLARCVGGALAVRRLIGASRTITEGPWLETLAQVRTGGLCMRLLECPDLPIPATCGLVRPVILLPPGSRNWPAEQRRLILLHELAHVRRRDGLWQLVGQFACALYWFNPLVWLLDRQVSLDRERACDDAVLTADNPTPPADYAQTLLEVAKNLQRTFIPQGVIPMARQSQLEPRVRSVLTEGRSRRPAAPRLLVSVLAIVASLVLPLSMLRGGDEPAAAPEGQFTITLPNGTQVELIGLSRSPSAGQPWWKPDGSLLEIPPYDQFVGGSVTSTGTPYEFAIRQSGGAMEGVTLKWGAVGHTGFAWGRGHKGGRAVDSLLAQKMILPASANTATIRLSYADGPWHSVAESQGYPSATSFGLFNSGIMWAPAVESEGGVIITLSHSQSMTNGKDHRVVAVDADGREHVMQSMGGVGAASVMQYTMRLDGFTRAQLKAYRLQTRPFRFFEFRNVSLQPGVKTDVQVVTPDGEASAKADAAQRSPALDAYPHELAIETGHTEFAEGDKIEITEVRGTSPDLTLGGTYVVKGRYTLSSRDQAKLAMFVTATKPGEGRTVIRSGQQIVVHRGSGEFELIKTLETSAGFPHISFYPADGGASFGGVYFGQEGGSHTIMRQKRNNIRDTTGTEQGASGLNTTRLTITRAYWPGSDQTPNSAFLKKSLEELRLKGVLHAKVGEGPQIPHRIVIHIEPATGDYKSLYEIVDATDRTIILRAEGQPPIRAEVWQRSSITVPAEGICAMFLNIAPSDVQKMRIGVAYALEPLNQNARVTWNVLPEVMVVRSEPPGPE